MKFIAAEIQSLGVEMPRIVRTNDYWRERYPELVRMVEQKGKHKVWSPPEDSGARSLFLEEMAPYLDDPFRGTLERRVLGPDETTTGLECGAARKALDAAGIGPNEIELTLCVSFLGDQVVVGNGAFLARALGLSGPVWNVESACAGALAAFDMASSLVGSGRAERVLVVTSCDYSRCIDERDVLSWTSGDGAAAFVVGRAHSDGGILGSHFISTTSTCGAIYFELCELETKQYGVRIQSSADAGRRLQESSEECIRRTCAGALSQAGVSVEDIEHFVFATPTAWYAKFCARSLGIDPGRCVNTYPHYANIGPVCWVANLYEHARTQEIRSGDLVLLCAIGSASSAGAIVARFGSMALG